MVAEAPVVEFSLDLNDEQRQLQQWVHGFAADVVRPAAAEWDEREETPWPVLEEAAKIGLYAPWDFGGGGGERVVASNIVIDFQKVLAMANGGER